MLPPRHDEASGICEAACEHEKMLHTGSEAKTTSSTRRALHSLASCQKKVFELLCFSVVQATCPDIPKNLGRNGDNLVQFLIGRSNGHHGPSS